MGTLYCNENGDSKYRNIIKNSIAFQFFLNEIALKTGVDPFEIKEAKEIPTMEGIKIFVGGCTREHAARIKVSNKSGIGIFSNRSNYDPVYIAKRSPLEFKIGHRGTPGLKWKSKEIEQIKNFYLRNEDAIMENWKENIDDNQLVELIHKTEMGYYDEALSI